MIAALIKKSLPAVLILGSVAPAWSVDPKLLAAAAGDVGQPSPVLPSLRLEHTGGTDAPAAPAADGGSRSAYVVPALFSALVPGTGEIYSGHWLNGLPLLALDVATWIGYAHYDSEGERLRSDFIAFADAHWSEADWRERLTDTRWWSDSAPYNCDCSPPYIPKEEDAREYYENLGKYRHFYPGWDDWPRYVTGPGEEENYPWDDPNTSRRQYVDMRIESNSNFDKANNMLALAAVNRVVSVIQSLWLVHNDRRSQGVMIEPFTFEGFGSGIRLKASF
jgi:hypothetical protein